MNWYQKYKSSSSQLYKNHQDCMNLVIKNININKASIIKMVMYYTSINWEEEWINITNQMQVIIKRYDNHHESSKMIILTWIAHGRKSHDAQTIFIAMNETDSESSWNPSPDLKRDSKRIPKLFPRLFYYF